MNVKIFLFAFLLLLPVFFSGQPLSASDRPGILSITTDFFGEMKRFSLAGNGAVVIDWGDGTPPEPFTLKALPDNPWDMAAPGNWEVPHIYSRPGVKIITIRGVVSGLYTAETGAVSRIEAGGMPGLEHLVCRYENLTSLDLSANPAVKTLDCSNNDILFLDIAGNASLEELYCFYNSLPSLDASGLASLRVLSCSDNELERLAVENCPSLAYLSFSDNKLSTLALRAVFSALPNRQDNAKPGELYSGGNETDALTREDRDALRLKNWPLHE